MTSGEIALHNLRVALYDSVGAAAEGDAEACMLSAYRIDLNRLDDIEHELEAYRRLIHLLTQYLVKDGKNLL